MQQSVSCYPGAIKCTPSSLSSLVSLVENAFPSTIPPVQVPTEGIIELHCIILWTDDQFLSTDLIIGVVVTITLVLLALIIATICVIIFMGTLKRKALCKLLIWISPKPNVSATNTNTYTNYS